MSIVDEKEEIIKRISQTEDISVIDAVKELLDFAQGTDNINLDKALKVAIMQSDNREVMPHDKVWAEIRNQYKSDIHD